MTVVQKSAPIVTAQENGLAYELATIRVLWQRDVVRFFRERSRVVGALFQPLVFWVILGTGFSPSFRIADASDVSYETYFFPGVVLMVVLFSAIFTTMSLIEDRRAGFLQSVLVGPGSRASVVAGKVLGSSSVALVQSALFLLLAPLAGFPYEQVDWPLLVCTLLLAAIALASLGFTLAWWLDSTQGYHVVMFMLLLPMWIASGAMFPLPDVEWAHWILRLNPMAYVVSALRSAFYGESLPRTFATMSAGSFTSLLVATSFALAMFGLAIVVCSRSRRT